MSARTAQGWLLEFTAGRAVAFAAHSTLALVESPACVHVPGAPPHAAGLMRWEGRDLALIDLGVMFAGDDGDAREADPRPTHALVVAWRATPDEPANHGAVAAPSLARMVEVRDDWQCPPPAHSGELARIALAWFEHEGRAVAVADPARLFAQRCGV